MHSCWISINLKKYIYENITDSKLLISSVYAGVQLTHLKSTVYSLNTTYKWLATSKKYSWLLTKITIPNLDSLGNTSTQERKLLVKCFLFFLVESERREGNWSFWLALNTSIQQDGIRSGCLIRVSVIALQHPPTAFCPAKFDPQICSFNETSSSFKASVWKM